MTRTTLAVLAALLLTGCAADEAAAPAPVTVTATTTATVTATAMETVTETVTATPVPEAPAPTAAAAPTAGLFLRPDGAQTGQLLAGLAAIDPGLGDARSVDRAVNVCDGLLRGDPREQVLEGIELRFEGGSVPDLSGEQAAEVLDVIVATFCTT